MIGKFIILAGLALSICDAGWCAGFWSPFASNRSKVYVGGEDVQGGPIEKADMPYADEKKKKPFVDMSWLGNIAPPKFNFRRQNNIPIVPVDGNETDSMTDDGSLMGSSRDNNSSKSAAELRQDAMILIEEARKAEELAQRKREAAQEAYARLRMAEDLEIKEKKEEEALAFADEGKAKELLERSRESSGLVNEFQGKLKDVQHSARLAQARAIRDEILAKKAEKEAVARARKEAFEAERKAALEISDAPKISAAEACFVNENEKACEQSKCRWNSLMRVCDIDCEKINGNKKYRENECHSAIGIRRKSGAEGKNASVIANKEYETSRICIFDSKTSHCLFRASRF